MREKLEALDICLRIGWERLAQGRAQWDPLKDGLSEMLVVESALLDSDHLAAVKLAILTKRLPMTVEDMDCQADESLELHERFASGFSGIGLTEYFTAYASEAGFTETTVRVAEFLVANRRSLKQFSRHGRNNEYIVSEIPDAEGWEQIVVGTPAPGDYLTIDPGLEWSVEQIGGDRAPGDPG